MLDYTALITSVAVLGSIPIILLLVRAGLRLSVRTCTCKASMKGKTVIVTGANAGIGFETALALAARGARVVLGCRSERRGLDARDRMLARVAGADIAVRRLDLASLASVRQFASETLASEPRLDVLVNNAGAVGLGNRHTGDGIVEEMQVNHFGPFLLTLLLLPLLHRSGAGRVVTVASVLHQLGTVRPDRLNREGHYGEVRTYANSKLCNVVFTAELARQLRAAGARVTANCLHPGIVRTAVAGSATTLSQVLFRALCWLCARSLHEAAQTPVHLAVAEELRDVSGEYFAECGSRWTRCGARSPRLGDLLWRYSESLVGFYFHDLQFD